MSIQRILALCAGGLLVLATLGCGGKSKERVTSYPREETLYIGGHQWSEPHNFNPLNSWPITWPARGTSNLMFECLFGYNILTGELEPLLGKEWSLSDSILSVALNEMAYWSDGTPVTPEDVVFTFELHGRYYTNHHSSWNYFDSLYISEETGELFFQLSTEEYNPLIMKDVIASVPIMPKHVFEPLEKEAMKKVKIEFRRDGVENELSGEEYEEAYGNAVFERMKAFLNLPDDKTDPIVSGPYNVYEVSPQKIVLRRVDNYWGNSAMYGGKMPAPKYIIHPIYKSNSSYNQALTQGKLDVSATFCRMIDQKKKDGVGTFYKDEPFYVPGSIPSLLICHEPPMVTEKSGKEKSGYTKDVLKDPVFRRACARAINKDVIRRIAIEKYAPPLKPGYIIPENDNPNSDWISVEGRYYSEKDAKRYGNTYDSTKAKNMLLEAGYTWANDTTMLAPSGDTVETLKIVCPYGWSDWETAVKICVQGMRSVGIPVREDFIDEGMYWETIAYGNFDFIVKTPQAEQMPSLPWSRFDKIMSGKEYVAIGEWASANQGRYKNKEADSLLNIIPRLDDEERISAYRRLNKIFMIDMPVIPLMYRPHVFYQFSTNVWTGYPTFEDGKGISPQNLNIGAAVKGLWQVELKK